MTQGNIAPVQRAPNPIDPGVRIGHVHLRTADIDRVRAFYVDVLGFDVVAEARYLSDPDGDDLELAWDRPIDQWPRAEGGGLVPVFGDLDLDDLLSGPAPNAP